ncbi:tRNA threonylcarbamoyladenosine dehydratase [Leeia oryzae]|uniref:tRNA threonylcarbamoyladenosine dehydratase n=1 Tax=Leeia oryzae TaxID=356662 RepID=UPI00036391F7|nr:tRNA threonylcarbamoyladenosine dehydratase [Leeia oryzae]
MTTHDLPADAEDSHTTERRFGGIARLYGNAQAQRFQQAHIVVIGVGGVGSWVAEALARTGVGRLTLIDLDNVAVSNVNRQVHALEGQFGKAKVTAMAERIRLINPFCQVHEIEDFVAQDNLDTLLLQQPFGRPDGIVDAIDQVRTKAALIHWCRKQKLPLVVAGGAGGKLDPTLLKAADLAQVIQDPLLAKVRTLLRREHGFAKGGTGKKMGVTCVFSEEPLQQPVADSCDIGSIDPSAGLNCAGYGSTMVVTATAGMMLAAQILARL